MTTLIGTPVYKGFAVAEAAVVGAGGLADLPGELIQRGIASIRRGDLETDRPTVVVACQSMEAGFSLTIPGIKTVGVAAQSPDGSPDVCFAPCVAGLNGLPATVKNGDIVIVDGARGVVHVDPDADTLAHYQTLEEERRKTRRVFLGSAHLPAVTQDGKPVAVFAQLDSAADVAAAVVEGADGFVFPRDTVQAMSANAWSLCLDEAGGKPLLLLSAPDDEPLRALVAMSIPLQVTIAVHADEASRVADLRDRVIRLSYELSSQDVEPGEIDTALIVDSPAQIDAITGGPRVSRLVIDITHCDIALTQTELSACISEAVDGPTTSEDTAQTVPTTVLIASSIDAVRYLTVDGVDSVATPLGLTAATKDLIRSFPSQ